MYVVMEIVKEMATRLVKKGLRRPICIIPNILREILSLLFQMSTKGKSSPFPTFTVFIYFGFENLLLEEKIKKK